MADACHGHKMETVIRQGIKSKTGAIPLTSCNVPPLHEHFGIDAIWGDIKSQKDNTQTPFKVDICRQKI